MNIYLIVGSTHSAIAVCTTEKNIDLAKITEIGDNLEVWEIGIANPMTPPGCLLVGPTDELTPLRPLGRKVY